eukprot:2763263-Amphidinium_carterae.3
MREGKWVVLLTRFCGINRPPPRLATVLYILGQQAPQADVKSRQLHVDMHGVDAYHVKYADGFEPFIVAARESIPAYDERFKGC